MKIKRILSMLLAVVMVFSLMPVVLAAEVELTGLAVKGLTVMRGDYLKSNGKVYTDHTCTMNVSTNSIGSFMTTGPNGRTQTSVQLTFINTSGNQATLSFNVKVDNSDPDIPGYYVVDETEYEGNQSFQMNLAPDGVCVVTLVSPYTHADTQFEITQITLLTEDAADPTVTFGEPENGSYTVQAEGGEIQTIEKDTEVTMASGTKYTMKATAAEGYRFFGWHNDADGSYVSYKAEDEIIFTQDMVIRPEFIAADIAVFQVGLAVFKDLSAADTYAKENGGLIVLLNNGTIAGEHTISAGNTLLIPYDEQNTVHNEATSTAIQVSESIWENVAWEKPTAYRTLTMLADAKITVEGVLNVGGRHSAGPFLTAGSPSGSLGMIRMAEDSNITINGGKLYCWGYIYGDGTVTVKAGGEVHENFQFTDFRGGNVTLALAQDFLVFPMSQYYVQNVEVATTFEYGATEYVWGSIYMSNMVLGTAVKFIGDGNLSMFVPGQNGSVTKTYDPATDRLIIDVNNGGSINPMGLELGGTAIDTATFVLPINSNMTININSGTTQLNQSMALLPGAQLNIAQGAVLSVESGNPSINANIGAGYQSGNNLIIYDRDQWMSGYTPVFNNGYLVGAEYVENTYYVYTNAGVKRLQPLAYTPTRNYTRTEADLVDAVVDINGTLITNGYIYTTVDIDLYQYFYSNNLVITGGGAGVTSSKGTGQLVMQNGVGPDNITLQALQNGTEHQYTYVPMVSARLQNADGSYLDTLGAAAGAKFAYCAECGQWYAGNLSQHKVDINFVVDGVGGTMEVCMNTLPVYNQGTDPVKAGFEFIGWSTSVDGDVLESLPVATQDAVYYACFKEATTGGLKGDLDGDGDVDAYDVTILARHVGGIQVIYDETILVNGDIDGDGDVDAYDLTTLARYVGGIITELP